MSKKVSGKAMLRAHQEMGKLQGQVGKSAERLAVSWSGEEIMRASNRTPSCTCPPLAANIYVHPEAAYNLARKSPARTAAEQGVTHLLANYGGVLPLYALGKVLGPWDSLIEELVPRRRG